MENKKKNPFLKNYKTEKDKVNPSDDSSSNLNNNDASSLYKLDIKEALKLLGASERSGDGSKYKFHLGHVIVKPGSQAFMLPFMGDLTGFGGFDLIRKSFSFTLKETFEWLKENMDEFEFKNPNVYHSEFLESKGGQHFTPPRPHNDNKDKIINYLVNERGLPRILIDDLMKKGTIYLDKNNHCVFLSDSGAELRSAFDGEHSFKGGVTGAKAELPGFGFQVEANKNAILREINDKKKAPAYAVAEAAITALSFHVLNPHASVLSSNGAGRFALHFDAAIDAYFDDSLPFEIPFLMATDADNAGDFAAQRLWNALYLRERLSSGLKIDIEDVDTWIKNRDIIIDLRTNFIDQKGIHRKILLPSEHTCFFGLDLLSENNELREMRVLKPELSFNFDNYEEGSEIPSYFDEETSAPVVSFIVKKGLHPAFKKDEYTVKVDAENYAKMDWVKRARPKIGKDWNDTLLSMRTHAHTEYMGKISLLKIKKKPKP